MMGLRSTPEYMPVLRRRFFFFFPSPECAGKVCSLVLTPSSAFNSPATPECLSACVRRTHGAADKQAFLFPHISRYPRS